MLEQDHIWQQTFGDNASTNHEWLELDSAFYESLEERIFPSKTNYRYLIAFLLGAVVFLTALTGGYMDHDSSRILPVSDIDRLPALLINQNKTSVAIRQASDVYTNHQQSSNLKYKEPISPTTIINNQTPKFSESIQFGHQETDNSTNKPIKRSNVAVFSQLEKKAIFLTSHPRNVSLRQVSVDHEDEIINEQRHTLRLLSGMSLYQLKLNQNFASAVQPAAFWHTIGKGVHLQLNYGFQINQQLSVRIGAYYENIRFRSGHNSELTLANQINEESSQQVGLAMATPTGFIEGEANIFRSANTTETETLNLALTNTHQMQSIGMQLLGEVNLLEGKGFRLDINGGIDIMHVVQATDKLESIRVSHSGYESIASTITSRNSLENSTISSFLTGVGVERTLRDSRRRLSLNYTFTRSIKPVFQANTLGTSLAKHAISLGFTF